MGDKNSKSDNRYDYGRAEYYYNRELSWVALHNRVLGGGVPNAREALLELIDAAR